MDAVRAYIREIRERRGISQEALAGAVGLSLRQVSRMESGESETIKADVLLKAVAFLGASIEQVNRLFEDPDASGEDARRVAQEWLTEEQRETVQRVVTSNSHEHIMEIAAYVRSLSAEELIDLISEANDASRNQQDGTRPRKRQPWRPWRRGSSRGTD